MSSLISGLVTSSYALNLQSQSLQTISTNINNIDNSDYARRKSSVTNGISTYKRLEETQLRDKVLEENIANEQMSSSSLEAQVDLLGQMESILGESIDGASLADTGLLSSMDSFFASWQQLAADPSDSSNISLVLTQSENLVNRLNDKADQVSELESYINFSIDQDLESANNLVLQIRDLNEQIVSYERSHLDGALDLRDARQEALKSLSALVGYSMSEDSSGAVELELLNADGSSSSLLDANGNYGTLSVDQDTGVTSITHSDSGLTDTFDFSGGSVGGAISVRENDITGMETFLDEIASNLVSEVNALYNPVAGSDFFDATNTTAKTISLDSSLSSNTLVAGSSALDNSLANAIMELQDKDIAFNADETRTFSEHILGYATDLGFALESTQQEQDAQALVQEMLEAQRAAYSGVDLNEEVTDMIVAQKNFQASARVVNSIDEMLDLVINRLGY